MDKIETRWLACRAKSFVLVEGELYKRNHTGILQRYIPFEQGKRLLSDIHGGVYSHHAAPRTLVRNVFRQGFYWPTAVADAEQLVCTYERVSILHSADPPTSPSTPEDPHHVVVRGLGARSGRTSQECAQGLYALACHHG